jgi:hypothetical protein
MDGPRRLRGAARAAAALIGFQSEAGQTAQRVSEPPAQPDWIVALDEHREQEALEAVLHAPLDEMMRARFTGHPESRPVRCRAAFRSRPMQPIRGIRRMRETGGDHA